jgi:hypothetical protein
LAFVGSKQGAIPRPEAHSGSLVEPSAEKSAKNTMCCLRVLSPGAILVPIWLILKRHAPLTAAALKANCFSMTAQINDTVFHRKIDFDLAGISGSGLFDAATLPVRPVWTSSACWRGYVAHYSIFERDLCLTSLHIGLPEDNVNRAIAGRGSELFGVLPKRLGVSRFLYEGFRLPIPFTGGLLLADGFIPELYVHMGFHPAWKYERVREVIFDAGRIIEDYDRSAEVAGIRLKFVEEMTRSQNTSREPSLDEVAAWIKKCFSRDY